MGFLKSVRKPISRLSKNKPKDHRCIKSISYKYLKIRNKRGQAKYASAKVSKFEKSDNARVYTFSHSSKHKSMEEDITISTASASSDSSGDVQTEPSEPYPVHPGLPGLSRYQIETCSSSESEISSPSVSSYTSSSEDSSYRNNIELRDDVSGDLIHQSSNRDHLDFDFANEIRELVPPLLPPPRKYVSDLNTICGIVNNDEQHVNINQGSYTAPSAQACEIRNKSLPIREIRRNASQESREYVHVFHLPLSPLDEEISLYDSGDDSGIDADDELLDDESSDISTTKPKGQQRRGSMNSNEDVTDLRHRWEYGLAMMAQMGIDTISHKCETMNEEDSINTLRCDDNYDEENAEEI